MHLLLQGAARDAPVICIPMAHGTVRYHALGRVVNRFSKDVDTIDNVLPMLWRMVISQAFAVNVY